MGKLAHVKETILKGYRRHGRFWLSFGLILAMSVLFYAPVLLGDRQFSHRDDSYFYIPFFEYIQEYWERGELPLWSPEENLGTPLLANATGSVFYPGKIIYFLPAILPLTYGFCYKLYVFSHLLLAAGGMYFLMRTWRFSSKAGLLAALSFAFSGTVFYQYCNVIYLVGAAWLPWSVWSGYRLLQSPDFNRFLILVLILSLMILGGEPQSVYFAGGLLVGMVFFRLGYSSETGRYIKSQLLGEKDGESGEKRRFVFRRDSRLGQISILFAAAVTVYLVCAIQIGPSSELMRHSDRTLYDLPESVLDVPPVSIWQIPGYMRKWNAFAPNAVPEKVQKGRPASMATGIANGLLCRTLDQEGHPKYIYSFNVNPWSYLEWVWPHLGGTVYHGNGRWFSSLPNDSMWYATIYMGIIPFLLAISALRWRTGGKRTLRREISPSRKRLACWATWTFLFVVLVGLGGLGPYWFYRAITSTGKDVSLALSNGDPVGSLSWFLNVLIPGYAGFRYPAKILVVATFVLSILAGIGWDCLNRKRVKRLFKTVFVLSAIALFMIGVSGSNLFDFGQKIPLSHYGPYEQTLAWNSAMSAVLHAMIIILVAWPFMFGNRLRRWRFVPAILILLTAFDLYWSGAGDVTTAPSDYYTRSLPLAQVIHTESTSESQVDIPVRYYRFEWNPLYFPKTKSMERMAEFMLWNRATLEHKYHLQERIANIHCCGTMFPDEYSWFGQWLLTAASQRDISDLLAFLGCQYVIYPNSLVKQRSEKYRQVTLNSSFIKEAATFDDSQKDTTLLDANGFPNDASLWRILRDTNRVRIYHGNKLLDDPMKTVLNMAQSVVTDERLASETVRITRYEANCIELEANLTQPGDLVLAEQYYPGWVARVSTDGKAEHPLNIQKTLGFLRRLSLDAGHHRIVMQYRPASFYRGATVSLLTVLLLSIVYFLKFRKVRFMKKSLLLILLAMLAFGSMTTTTFAADPVEPGFVSLFNGKDLTGWTGDERLWSVEDGAIVGRTFDDSRKITYNQSLAWKDEVSNFILRYDFRISKTGNSGMYYRGWYLDKNHPYQMGGYQADFDGSAAYSGIVYGESLRGILANLGTITHIQNDHKPVAINKFAEADELRKTIKIEDWNSYEVVVSGYTFIHKINGEIRSILVDNDKEVRRDKGLIGIQLHVGPPMKVEVKNIRMKTL